MLAGFSLDVSHQEIERILGEVESWYFAAADQAGVEWLPLDGIRNFLFNDLGYEDLDEFEDALHGTFEEFLGAFPHVELKKEMCKVEDEKEDNFGEEVEKFFIKLRQLEKGPPRKLVLKVETSGQLLTTCLMQAEDATIEIPSLEFMIGAANKRRIDSLYNHIVTAKENLENHAKQLGESSAEATGIMETVRSLSAALDVEAPFEIVLNDPYGQSEFKPDTGVRILAVDDA